MTATELFDVLVSDPEAINCSAESAGHIGQAEDRMFLGAHECREQDFYGEVWVELWAERAGEEWIPSWFFQTPETSDQVIGELVFFCPLCGVHLSGKLKSVR